MVGFLSKLFGGGAKRNKAELFIEDKMQTLINKTGLKLSFDLKVSEDQKKILIDLYGEDEAIAKDRDAQLLDAFQLFLKRTSQNQFPEEKMSIIVDCDSYREQSDDDLIKIAEKLKGMVLKKKKPAFFRALPPRERKIIHQYLSEDKRFRTKSVGDGMYKKIKISLAGDKASNPNPNPKPRSNMERKGPKPQDAKGLNKESQVKADETLDKDSTDQDILSTDV
jgi:spoIIIJ-associated protein